MYAVQTYVKTAGVKILTAPGKLSVLAVTHIVAGLVVRVDLVVVLVE